MTIVPSQLIILLQSFYVSLIVPSSCSRPPNVFIPIGNNRLIDATLNEVNFSLSSSTFFTSSVCLLTFHYSPDHSAFFMLVGADAAFV